MPLQVGRLLNSRAAQRMLPLYTQPLHGAQEFRSELIRIPRRQQGLGICMKEEGLWMLFWPTAQMQEAFCPC